MRLAIEILKRALQPAAAASPPARCSPQSPKCHNGYIKMIETYIWNRIEILRRAQLPVEALNQLYSKTPPPLQTHPGVCRTALQNSCFRGETTHSVTRTFSAPPDTTLHALLSTALWVFLNSEFSIISVQPPIPQSSIPGRDGMGFGSCNGKVS